MTDEGEGEGRGTRHVPLAKLDEYRAARKAAQALDDLQHWYYVRGRNPPKDVRGAWRDVVALMARLRTGRTTVWTRESSSVNQDIEIEIEGAEDAEV
jgi:hypothetical protein